ncbi:MAG: DNRLRE domain-containing protein [Anaerolineales bacterium]|nr:DNRLRE domain-containing protein [Anaerolineales bacterium]
MSGDQLVQASVSVTGQNPGITKIVFYLDNEYLLIDYQPSYSFTLPSADFIDGVHNLEAEAEMRDGVISQRVGVDLTFNNGVIEPPVNTNTFTPTSGRTPAAGEPFVLAAVGDGASGELAAGAVSDLIVSWNPNMFFYLGDVYEKGTSTEFYNWYGVDTYFGRLKSVTNPVVGNHEFENGVAPGYFDYWDNIPNYYSYYANSWRFIAMDSNASGEIGSPQYEWLTQEMAANTAICTIAYFHHPIFNVGPQGDTPRMNDSWSLLVQNGVDIVLTGHDHNYQRWLPLDAFGNLDSNGVTHFVIGGGGHGVRGFVATDDRLARGYDRSPDGFGALRLELNPDGAAFQYANMLGAVLDSGVIPCRGAAPDTTNPSDPTNLTAVINQNTKPELDWSASSDNTGVASYAIYRDEALLASVDGAFTSYVDMSAQLNATHTYKVVALDPAGNSSAPSNSATVTTPSSGAITFLAVADSYVNQDAPGTNYGTSNVLRTDIAPQINSYLRFNVQGLSGLILRATLRVYATSNSSIGYSVYSSSGSGWDERTLDFNNAPAIGSFVGSSGGFAGGAWTEVDVTSLVTVDGDLDLILATDSASSISYSSREGSFPPELVVEISDTPPPTSTPTPAAAPGTFLFEPAADTYVSAASPDSNYGGATQLRVDASPDIRGYVRYNVQGLAGIIVSARLRVYANSGSGIGYEIYQVSDSTWDEQQLTYNTAPPFGNFVGSSGGYGSNSWIEIDVTPLVGGEGALSLAIVTSSDTALSFSSREGANPPELIIETVALSPTPTFTPLPTDTPTPTATDTPTPLPTDTPTPTATDTLTPLPTDMPTPTATDTPTPLPTDTPTPTATSTPGIFTFTPISDAYVYASKPDTNYGNSVFLRADASPDTRSYLRFDVQGLAGYIFKATLRVYANSSSSTGYSVFTVGGDAWDEYLIAYNNAPALGGHVGSSGGFAGRSWTEVDVTALVAGNGGLNFALATAGNTAISFSSREGGAAPELVIETSDTPLPSPTPTSPQPTPTATPAPTPGISTFTPVSDAYVYASKPDVNYGSSVFLRADASPDTRSYLRFNVQGLAGTLVRATLRVYANSSSSTGYDVFTTSDNSWDEFLITYNTAPAFGGLVGSSGGFAGKSWTEIDVTALINGDGILSFALATVDNTAISLSSRSGNNPPELVIETIP